ncbi:hypothetical protein CEJ86_32515 [Sinorhizobium meliloti]|uniref:Uncharacterized protein n=1 Tax=Rhizobium meliloti TaxID=382 RepID=A0A2J0YT34_RHIML|nr:hypothetical protein CEJ86_32515 [Sinorhizobium meliloti]
MSATAELTAATPPRANSGPPALGNRVRKERGQFSFEKFDALLILSKSMGSRQQAFAANDDQGRLQGYGPRCDRLQNRARRGECEQVDLDLKIGIKRYAAGQRLNVRCD